jgi:hypothetical protein
MMTATSQFGSAALFVPGLDEGLSPAAQQLRATLQRAFAPSSSCIPRSRELGETRLLSALGSADAEGTAVPRETFAAALDFLWALPSDVPLPEIVVAPDGEIGFDWNDGPRRVLSVAVGNRGSLGYAALLGFEPVHGRVPFAGAVPRTVAHILGRLFPSPMRGHR